MIGHGLLGTRYVHIEANDIRAHCKGVYAYLLIVIQSNMQLFQDIKFQSKATKYHAFSVVSKRVAGHSALFSRYVIKVLRTNYTGGIDAAHIIDKRLSNYL